MAAYATYLGVNIGDIRSLLGVMTFVDFVSSVEVLTNDITEGFTLRGGMRIVMGLGLPLDLHGAGLLLDLVDFAQGGFVRSKS